MPKVKNKRFDDNKRLPNVIEYTDFKDPEQPPKGKWNSKIFENEQPIVLELACGKGEYSLGLSDLDNEKNYIGVDLKGNRLWVGATKALGQEKNNIRFLRIFIGHIEQYFARDEVDDIWIIFPDPQLKKERKRLTSPRFLNYYRSFLKKGGTVNLKTDSELLYLYTKDVIMQEQLDLIEDLQDVHAEKPNDPRLAIKTYYEKMHLKKGKKIKFLSFRL